MGIAAQFDDPEPDLRLGAPSCLQSDRRLKFDGSKLEAQCLARGRGTGPLKLLAKLAYDIGKFDQRMSPLNEIEPAYETPISRPEMTLLRHG